MLMYTHGTHLLTAIWTGTCSIAGRLIPRHGRPRHGQGLVEYALILVLIAIVTIGVLTTLGIQIRSTFDQVACVMGGGEYHRDNGNGNSNRCR